MNLCSNGHDEICYDSRRCPTCQLLDKITDLEGERDNLRDKIRSLERELQDLENQ